MTTRTSKSDRASRIWHVACVGLSIGLMFPAYGGFEQERDGVAGSSPKISPVLEEEVDFLVQNPDYDYAVPVIVQVDPGFFQRSQSLRRSRAADFDNSLSLIHAYPSRLKAREIQLLLRSPLVRYVTLDAVLRTNGKNNGKGKGKGNNPDADTDPAPSPGKGKKKGQNGASGPPGLAPASGSSDLVYRAAIGADQVPIDGAINEVTVACGFHLRTSRGDHRGGPGASSGHR